MRVKFRFSRLKIFTTDGTIARYRVSIHISIIYSFVIPRDPNAVKIMVSEDGKAWRVSEHTGKFRGL